VDHKLTNRSIHSIRRVVLRRAALEITPAALLAQKEEAKDTKDAIRPPRDIWEVDYKSTSDEEDNDSEEDEYGNAFPKPK
jgi:hypothetical protein